MWEQLNTNSHKPVKVCIVVWQALLLAVVLLFCMTLGCGKKGPPKPPETYPLPVVKNLDKDIINGWLSLHWPIPDEKGGPPLSGFYVLRSKTSADEEKCDNCPKIFKRVADIAMDDNTYVNMAQRRVVYRETMEKGYSYIYKVVCYSKRSGQSKESDVVAFEY